MNVNNEINRPISPVDASPRVPQNYKYVMFPIERNCLKYASTICFHLCDYLSRTFHEYYHGNTPLHYSVLFEDLKNLKISHLEFVNARNVYEETPLILASKIEKLAAVQELVQNGADIRMADLHGKNALHHAATSKNAIEIAKLLLERGSNPAALDKDGNSGVHLSAGSGNLNMLKLFYIHSAPLDDYNAKGQTPLMLAAFYRKINNVHFLIQQGADITKRKNPFCKSVFEYALMGKDDRIIDLLLQKGVTHIFKSVDSSPIKRAETLLFEKIVRRIKKVEFQNIYDEQGKWKQVIVHLEGFSCPLLDIFRGVQWELVHFDEQDYELLFNRKELNTEHTINGKMQLRLSLEEPQEREILRAKFQHLYSIKLNAGIWAASKPRGWTIGSAPIL